MSAGHPDLFPPIVYTLWWAALIASWVFFVPLSVYLLHRTWRAARSIQRYAADSLVATRGIAGGTRHLPALDSTVEIAAGMLPVARSVEGKLEATATAVAERAR